MNQQYNSSSCFACGLENPSGLRLRFFDNGKDQVFAHFTIATRGSLHELTAAIMKHDRQTVNFGLDHKPGFLHAVVQFFDALKPRACNVCASDTMCSLGSVSDGNR